MVNLPGRVGEPISDSAGSPQERTTRREMILFQRHGYRPSSGRTDCSCPCGYSHVAVSGTPVLRFLCHCTICQSVYRKPFADVVVVRASQIATPIDHSIQVKRYKAPPALDRGVCSACSNPVVALLPLTPFFGLAFVPSANFPAEIRLPDPSVHVFYERRVADVDDAIRKVSGFWPSQWEVTSRFITGLLRSKF
jgi:hypothetical protein